MTDKFELRLENFEPDIVMVARKFCPVGLDSRGNGQDDYANQLRFVVYKIIKRLNSSSEEDMSSYVRTAIWNAAKSMVRDAGTYRRALLSYQVSSGVSGTYNPYEILDCRLDLQKLRDKTPETFDTLATVMLADGPNKAPNRPEASRTTIHRWHKNNLHRAREALERH